MTLVVVLLLGLGAVLIVSSFETDAATGRSVSVLKTIGDVWNGSVDFTQPALSATGGVGGPGSVNSGGFPLGPGGSPDPNAPDPSNPGVPSSSPPVFTTSATKGGTSGGSGSGVFIGSAAGPAAYDAYRMAQVRAYIQSQR